MDVISILVGAVVGAVVGAAVSVPVNLFVIEPLRRKIRPVEPGDKDAQIETQAKREIEELEQLKLQVARSEERLERTRDLLNGILAGSQEAE